MEANAYTLLALCEGNHLAICEENLSVSFVRANHQSLAGSPWPHKGPVMWSFDIYFVVSPNKLLIKQLICRWFEMPWRSCGVSVMLMASLGSVWLIGCYCFQERLGLQTVGESIPMCAKCGKCFTRMWSLQQHDREVHQKTKTHVCPYCFRAFARNTNLTQHINRHRRKSLIATGAALARQFLKGPSSSVAQQPPPPPPQELVQRDSWPKSPDYMPFKEMVRSGPYVVEDLSMGQASKENKPVDGWGWWGHVYDWRHMGGSGEDDVMWWMWGKRPKLQWQSSGVTSPGYQFMDIISCTLPGGCHYKNSFWPV